MSNNQVYSRFIQVYFQRFEIALEKTLSVVVTTPYLTVHLVSVILTGINHVVVIIGVEIVVELQHIALVIPVQTTHVYTETGKNQMVYRSGDTIQGVVVTPPYLTVHLVSVILTEINHVVVIIGMEIVVELQHIALVLPVQTTNVFTKSGMNQMVHRS